MVIKPSGVDYDKLKPEHMVVTDLFGKRVEGELKPSSDLDTHTLLYREFLTIGAVVHTHSEFATSFAQAGMAIPAFGTTHADYFYGPVPVTEVLPDDSFGDDYVHETGVAIVTRFTGIDPLAIPAVLVNGHAPFCWGRDAHDAAHNAVVLESVAKMAYRTLTLNPKAVGCIAGFARSALLQEERSKSDLRTIEQQRLSKSIDFEYHSIKPENASNGLQSCQLLHQVLRDSA